MNLTKKLCLTALTVLMASVVNTSYAANKALIVGVGKYQNPENNLDGIDLDTNMAQQLALRLDISPSNIKRIADNRATVNGMREAMKWAASDVEADDTVLIYVSGHGSQVTDQNSDEQDGYDETLYLYDGHFIDDEFGQLIKAIPSKNVLVFIDACHSGTVTKGWKSVGNAFNAKRGMSKFIQPLTQPAPASARGLARKDVAIEAAGDNYLLIAAAQDNQKAVATADGSIFTKALLETFEKKRTKGGDFTWNDVFEDTKNSVIAADQNFYPNLEGNKQLATKSIRVTNVASTSNTSSARPVWRETESVASQGKNFPITAPSSVEGGQLFSMVFEIPTEGYLNIVVVNPLDKATVLFPNHVSQNNKVSAGTFDFAKQSFQMRATPPLGEHLMAAFVTKKPMNFTDKGMGGRDSKGNVIDFSKLTAAALKQIKDVAIESKEEGEFYSVTKVMNFTGR